MKKLPMAQSSPVRLVFFHLFKTYIAPDTTGLFLNEPDLSGPIGCTSQKTELGRFSPYVLVDNITYVYVDLKLYSTFTFRSINWSALQELIYFTDLNHFNY